jgi:hypothetical protein
MDLQMFKYISSNFSSFDVLINFRWILQESKVFKWWTWISLLDNIST